MQLGELQSQYPRFTARDASIIAISVDRTEHSERLVGRLNLQYIIASDSDQTVMSNYRIINPETNELALHAVFVVDRDRKIFYRKVASRRPLAQELLDAIDYHNGNYPLRDEKLARGTIPVAFPRNDFQALIEVTTNSSLPVTIESGLFREILTSNRNGQSDAATIQYKTLLKALVRSHTEQELLATAAWFTKTAVGLEDNAVTTGMSLSQALSDQRRLRNESAEMSDVQSRLDILRHRVRNNASEWQLRRLKTTLRSYRELTFAALSETAGN